MKRIVYFFGVFTALILLFSCSEEDALLLNDSSYVDCKVPSNPHRVSLENALAQADALLSQLSSDESKTRVGRSVKSVEYTLNAITRSALEDAPIDTALYVVNYADNQGFALLGADDRLQPIYAISDEGSFSFEDTIENKGLADWLREVDVDIKMSEYNITIDTTLNPPTPPINIDDRTVTVLKKVNPYLGKYQRLWGQNGNFNSYCFNQYTFSYQKVGCVPLAVGMIMSYYKWPRYRGNYYIDWDYINRWDINSTQGNCPDRLAWMLHEIGVALNAEYGSEIGGQTSVSEYFLKNNMPALGYEKLGEPFYFAKAEAHPEIRITFGPLLVAAQSPSVDYPDGDYRTGHAWVIDGYLYTKTESSVLQNPIYREYFHCIWGWNGKSNGYFIAKSDNSFGNSKPDRYDEDDLKDKNTVESTYLKVRFWCNFNKLNN